MIKKQVSSEWWGVWELVGQVFLFGYGLSLIGEMVLPGLVTSVVNYNWFFWLGCLVLIICRQFSPRIDQVGQRRLWWNGIPFASLALLPVLRQILPNHEPITILLTVALFLVAMAIIHD